MKAVVTVIGKDTTGIIARVSGLLYELNVNILDISQTVLDDLFAMILLADTSACTLSFEELQKRLTEQGEAMGVETTVRRYEIFEASHRI